MLFLNELIMGVFKKGVERPSGCCRRTKGVNTLSTFITIYRVKGLKAIFGGRV